MEYTTEFILSETKKIQYLYGLKREVRYQFDRTISDFSESVADHIYAMHILANYFLPLVDPDNKLDRIKIYEMITWHDIDEIETGDTIGYLKTDADRANEAIAAQKVVDNVPDSIRTHVSSLLTEYNNNETTEANFVKAIDKIEPLFHLYNEEGKELLHQNGTTFEDSDRIKQPYIKHFPIIKLYSDTIGLTMKEEGYFKE